MSDRPGRKFLSLTGALVLGLAAACGGEGTDLRPAVAKPRAAASRPSKTRDVPTSDSSSETARPRQASDAPTAASDVRASVPAAATSGTGPYTVSPEGGTPATGPGDRFNHCERIWCLVHEQNFYIDHYRSGHVGWILHDDPYGDVFVPRGRTFGPKFQGANIAVLELCGLHFHPHVLPPHGGPVYDGSYTVSLGYSRSHFHQYGTRLDPCCVNGQGFDYVHARTTKHFDFHDLTEYRGHDEVGWQKPFVAKPAPAR